MAFGEFTLYRGRNAYTVTSMKISDYFSSDMKDIDSMYMGMYFLELADYYGREGIEAGESPERSALLLLFQHRRPTLDHQSPHVEGVASSNLAVSAQNRSVGEQ